MGRNIWRWYQKNKNLCGGATHFHTVRWPWPGVSPPSPPRLVVRTLTIPGHTIRTLIIAAQTIRTLTIRALTLRTLTMLQRSAGPAG